MTTVGLLHPGEMGAAVGAVLAARVVWASEGRSAATADRAAAAGLSDVGSVAALCAASDVVLSVCPPRDAESVARTVTAAGFAGLYVDANAVAPRTAERIAAVVGSDRYVDGGIVGAPPGPGVSSRLFLSGPRAGEVAALVGGSLEAVVLDGSPTAASAVKMAYAAWTKGSAALLLATAGVAESYGVGDALRAEWARSQPALADRYAGAARSARAKGWRWVGEMTEIAATFEAVAAPGGFHRAAAEVYGDYPRPE